MLESLGKLDAETRELARIQHARRRQMALHRRQLAERIHGALTSRGALIGAAAAGFLYERWAGGRGARARSQEPKRSRSHGARLLKTALRLGVSTLLARLTNAPVPDHGTDLG